MRDAVLVSLLLAVLPTGCGTDTEVLPENIEHQIQWEQVPGEIQDCHIFKLDNVRAVEVDRLQVKFPEGSHHVHIYRSNEPVPDKVYDCFSGIDWTKWSLVVGAQTKSMDWQLPEGVTVPLEPHQQLLAQVHWLNTTDKTIQPTIDLSFHTTESSQEHLGTVFGVNKRIDIAPGQRTRVEQFCPMPEGAKLHALMGHFHMHGYDYKVTEHMPGQTDGAMVYQAPDEPAFEFTTYAPAHEVQRGAGFQFGCSFFNFGDREITWGSDTKTQEHCNMTAYFSPAEKISDLCLLEPSKLSALAPTQQVVRAGDYFPFDVQLASAEKEDVTVTLASSDTNALTVPETIVIPAGQTHFAFNARTFRPGAVEVTATLSGTRIVTAVHVGGLVISEVFYLPATGATNNLQWVKLANQTNQAIDLSSYTLGAGTTDFMNTQLPLSGVTIPAGGCVVVGGTESSPANGSPRFTLAQDFSPDLSVASDRAAGIALFTTAGMSPTARPIDAVVYGGAGALLASSLRGPDGQIAPVWPGSTPGGSLRRVSDNVWANSPAPTPGNCEVLNAVH